MEYYSLMDHWGSLVRQFKDSELEFDQDGYASEQIAHAILNHTRWTRFRQYKLFAEQRGEEFEREWFQGEGDVCFRRFGQG